MVNYLAVHSIPVVQVQKTLPLSTESMKVIVLPKLNTSTSAVCTVYQLGVEMSESSWVDQETQLYSKFLSSSKKSEKHFGSAIVALPEDNLVIVG